MQSLPVRKSHSAGGIVLSPCGDVLLVNQHNNSWSLPKGHLRKGETALAAAQREIYEESGIVTLSLKAELGSYTRFRIGLNGKDDTSEEKTITIFLFTTPDTALCPQDPANPAARWVPPHVAAEMLTHPRDREFFRTSFLAVP